MTDSGGLVTIRYSSALLRSVTGTRTDSVSGAEVPSTVAALLARLEERYGMKFAELMRTSLVLLDGVPVRDLSVPLPRSAPATLEIVQLALGG